VRLLVWQSTRGEHGVTVDRRIGGSQVRMADPRGSMATQFLTAAVIEWVLISSVTTAEGMSLSTAKG